jgi:hypothetical protein
MLDPLKLLSSLSFQLLLICVNCGEVHGWGGYNFTEATIYTSSLNGTIEDIEGKWSDYCEYSFYDYFTLYCDDNQYLDEHWECINSGSYFGMKVYPYIGLVHFHDNSPNYTITTKSQEYFKELKTRVKNNDSSVYLKSLTTESDIAYQSIFNRYMIAPFTYKNEQNIIFVLNNNLDIVMMDYRCSLIYVRLYYGDLVERMSFRELEKIDYAVVIVSIISLLLVIKFYLIIKDLRKNIIGKSTLIMVIVNCCFYIVYKAGKRSDNSLLVFLKNYLVQLNDPWLFFVVWDSFRFIRYLFYWIGSRSFTN